MSVGTLKKIIDSLESSGFMQEAFILRKHMIVFVLTTPPHIYRMGV